MVFDDKLASYYIGIRVFVLQINGPWFTKSRINSLKLILHPRSNDTWWFNFVLEMTFSNGERITKGYTGQAISEDYTEKVYTPII